MTFDSQAWIEACEPLLGLEVSEAARSGVKLNLEIATRLSALVMDFPLDAEAEPAPVFVP